MTNTWLEIDLAAIRDNVQSLKGLTCPGTQFLAVVKANAYGHGLVPVARAALAAGADWLGVNSATEALALREAGITAPILVLGVTSRESLADLSSADISVGVSSLEWFDSVRESLNNLPKPLAVHLKIETGTHRLGVAGPAAVKLAKALSQHPRLKWQGTYSHLAAVEEQHAAFTRSQAAIFSSELERLSRIANPGVRHLSASAAIMLYPELNFDMVRCGIAIYGLWPSEGVKAKFERKFFLRPALTWKTKIVQIKRVTNGTIGYGRTFRIKQPMMIGVLPVGYAEGYDRRLSNKAEVLIGGVRCSVVGRVAMNMTVVAIPSRQLLTVNVKNGAEVVLIGQQGDEEIGAEELAGKIGTINYEVVTRIPAHIPRIYIGE